MTRHEIREELESHLAQRIRDNVARGMAMQDATREAEQRFGSLDRAAASCERIDDRRQSPWRGWRMDGRAALVGLRRSPLSAVLGVAIVAAGLSVTISTAMLADALFFRPPAGVRGGADLRLVMNSFDGEHPSFVPYETCIAMVDALPGTPLFCRGTNRVQVVAGGVTGVRSAEFVTSAYFPTLGTRLDAGRPISHSDEQERAAIAVVSNRFARAMFDGAASAVGQSIKINGRPIGIIGVTEPGFLGQMSADPADLFMPVSLEPALAAPSILPDGRTVRGLVEGRMGWLMGVLRLPPGQSADALRARLTHVVRGDKPLRPGQAALLFDRAWLTPFSGDRDRLTAVLRPLGAAVALTLLLSAACLSSLWLGRMVSRRQELVVRRMLGASTARLARLPMLECLAVVVAGAIVAAPASVGLLAALSRLQLTSGIRIGDVATSFDARTIGFTAALAAVIAVVAMPGPLFFIRRLGSASLHGTRLVTGGASMRRALMAAQVAIGCALLAGSGLLTRSIGALERQPLGYDATQIGYLELEPARSGLSAIERAALLDRLRVETSADRTLAAADFAPFGGDDSRIVFAVDSPLNRPIATPAVQVLGGYFEMLGIEVLAGQTLAGRRAGERVIVISKPLGEYFWPGQAPIGRELRLGGPTGPSYEVIGVVSGVRDVSLRGRGDGRIYFPFGDDAETLTVMRRAPEPGAAANALARQVLDLDARLVPVRSGAVTDLIRRSLDQRMMFRLITTIVGIGSLFIVGVGVWGLAHGTVARRWREFGLRLALGADRREVLRLAMKDAAIVLAAGGTAGLFAAWQFGRALESWLFGVTARDPLTLVGAAALVSVAVLAGNSLPARRASRLDPAELLRQT